MKTSHENLFAFALIVTGLLFLRYEVFFAPMLADTFRLITASQNPLAHTVDYWLHVFSTGTFGPQYRPISFFATFFWGREIFGEGILQYRVFGFLVFSGSLFLFYQLLKSVTTNKWISLFLVFAFMIHPASHYLLAEVSHIEKYFMPFLELTLGLYLIKKNPVLSARQVILLCLLSVVAILSHEGAFVFPFVFVAFSLFWQRKLGREHLWLFGPSAVYLLARFFYFGVPKSGFMKVNYWSIFELMPKYFHHIVFPSQWKHSESQWLNIQEWGGLSAFALTITVVLMATIIDKNYRRGFLVVAVALVLAPFSVLENHFVRTREFWGVALWLFLWGSCWSIRGSEIKVRLLKFVLLGTLLVKVFFAFDQRRWMTEFFAQKTANQELFYKSIEKQLSSKETLYVLRGGTQPAWYFTQNFAGFLAYRFPDYKFLLNYPKPASLTFIAKGTYYNHAPGLSEKWYDPFVYPSPAPNLAAQVQLIEFEENSIDHLRPY